MNDADVDVVVTGLGTVSCQGSGTARLWRGMRAATSAPTRVPDPHARMPHPLMYLVPEVDLPAGPPDHQGLELGRCSRLALAAAREAVADAGLGGPDGLTDPAAVDPSRVAVVIGSGMGDAELHERRRAGAAAAGDRWAPLFPVASAVAGWLGARGAGTSVSNACSAGGFALSMAADLIRCGEADVVVAGGADAYSRVGLAAFNAMGAIDPERCRPFDADRRGAVFGEGAAVLVLESAAHARRRGARRGYARLAGAGWSCDAHHETAPEPEGEQIGRAMRRALAEAGAKGGDIGCVVPHGTGTELNDVVESRVLGEVLGGPAGGPPLYSLKALLGHTGGAAAAFGAVAAALVLHHRTVPPNVPVDRLDPRCPVRLPAAEGRLEAPDVLVNAYAFGGNNVSLVFGPAPELGEAAA
ncbi:beta-ketoacyl synthase N-terminal-like domain-containing protein [Streptomyces sp. SAJ15]|uniref:beta-ketoacyl synthase N-terminal-like domain-containing protein n=1 Tax=Streptomyces sp. SAJ15 TaxID=2011095 RepID=UPI0011850BD9|nr:beta-ketoacyl synthase N-terminal-like domain-containing protein [Streptomyces sp. SAJ15]TVL89234.1 3-oxoacyl-ACP synthase [Streptomyces sp. SAJ15]